MFYHLRYPTLALDLVRRATDKLMMFQCMTMPGADSSEAQLNVPRDLPLDGREALCEEAWPKMAFIEHRIAGDATNWWAPDRACAEALLRSAGFQIIAHPEHEFFLCTPNADPGHADLGQVREVARSDATIWTRENRT